MGSAIELHNFASTNQTEISSNAVRGEVADRVAAAEYMEESGQIVSILVVDGNKKVGGITCIAHNNELVHGVPFRNHDYDKLGVGKYIFYLVFETARKLNLKAVDLGGGHAYKKRFARIKGGKYEMRVCGNVVKYQLDRAMRRLHRATHAGRPGGRTESDQDNDDRLVRS
jgi:CelD/BcsL family acetyltransferase involved in cellulose biosynthesis